MRPCVRQVLAWLLFAFLLGASSSFAGQSAAATTKWLPTLLVPPRSGKNVPAIWDSLASIENLNHWAVSESLAIVLEKRLTSASSTDSLLLAHALLYEANGWIKLRRFAGGSGFATLERAIGIRERQAGPDDRLAIWGHMLAATFYPEAGKPELAKSHSEAAIARLQAIHPLDESWMSNALMVHATALNALRDWDKARPEYEAAIRMRQSVDGPEGRLLVPMLAEYGAFLSRMGEFDRARSLLRRAVHISEVDAGPGKSSDFLEGSLSRLSSLENKTGNISESLDIAQRAYFLVRKRLGDASLLTVRARTVVAYRLMDLGDYRGAAALLREIVPAMESGFGPQHPQTVTARLSLVESTLGVSDTTRVAHELAVSRLALAAQDPLANSNWIYLLQMCGYFERIKGNTDAARESSEVALEIEKRKHDPTGDNYAAILTYLLKTVTGPRDQAFVTEMNKEVDWLRDSTTVRGTAGWSLLIRELARAESRAGLRDVAWTDGLTAEALNRERLEYEVKALPDRHALQLAGEFGESCDLLVSVMRPADETDIRTAWDRFVRWRGLVREEISQRRLPAQAASDSLVVLAHARWMEAQRRLGQLVVGGAAHPEDPATQHRFETARREAEECERAYARMVSKGNVAADSVTLRDVLTRLGPDQGLVAFAIASNGSNDDRLGAFIASGKDKRPEWISFGRVSEIEPPARAWIASLGTPPTGASGENTCRELGRVVRDRVWKPIAAKLGETRDIFLVPEGVAEEIPWLALPEPGRKYLADAGVTIRIIEAERDLLTSPPSREPAGDLLAVGGPDFDRGMMELTASATPHVSEVSRAWRCTGSQTLSLRPLPGAEKEAEEIAGVWSKGGRASALLVGTNATEHALKTEAPGKAFIHIATHGVVVDDTCSALFAGSRGVGGIEPIKPSKRQNARISVAPATPANHPWLGRQVWLALSGANHAGESPDENEGLLTAEEIVTMDLRGTEWVVLSACQSALGSGWNREGVLGMQRSFHLAGARSVIASHWSIGDESTREWMNALYAARVPGKPAGAAVGDACRAVLAARRANGRSTHPFYWAAFMANGE
jgi:CHAT domain-containing protein/tetratricopeptide (TPR) repeat protein